MTTNVIELPDFSYSAQEAVNAVPRNFSPSDSGVIILNGRYMVGFSQGFAVALARTIRVHNPSFVALTMGGEEWYTAMTRELNVLGIECGTDS